MDPGMPPASPPMAAPAPVVAPRSPARWPEVERTGTGILFLIVAVLLGWIPVVEILGLVFGAIGVILLLMGMDAFGSRHATLVIASVLLYILALVMEFSLAASFVSTAASPTSAAQVTNAIDGLLVGSLVALAVTCVAQVLVVFALLDRGGRILLVAAAALQVGTSVLLFALVLIPLINQAVTQAFASGTYNDGPIVAADQQVRGMSVYTLLNFPPALIFAAGYSWAYNRVKQGVVPPTPAAAHPAAPPPP